MTEAQVLELLVLVFKDDASADEGLKTLKEAQKEELIEIINAAVLRKNADGKISYQELADLRLRKKGRMIGGVAGASLALLGGPAGLLVSTVVGAVGGGLLSRLKDKGLPNDQLKELADTLDVNTSALVAVVDHVWVQQVIDEVAEQTAQVVREQLSQEAQAAILTVAVEENAEAVEDKASV